MKYIFLSLFIFLAARLPAQNTVYLSGHMEHSASDSISVSYNDNNLAYFPKEFFTRLDKKGNFSFSFPLSPGHYTQAEIKHGQHLAEVILQPGDSLTMRADAAHFDSTVHYSGRGSTIENFIAKHTTERGRMNQYTIKIKTDINKEPADFLKSIEKEKSDELGFLAKNNKGLPVSFIAYWTAFYRYYNYFFMEQYPQIHEMVKLKRYTDSIPLANYAVVKDIPYAFSDSFLQLPPYLLYLTGIFEIKLKAAGYAAMPGKDTVQQRMLEDSAAVLVNKTLPDKSKEYIIAGNIYGKAKKQLLAKTEGQFSSFKKQWPVSEYLPLLERQVAIAEKQAPGQPAPDIDITMPDGSIGKLSGLKGKVVYLHFWAAWCKQCVGEMISEKKMKPLLKDKPLEFVYVSIDADTSVAQALIKKYKLSGAFTYAAGGWNAREIQAFGVQSLPAYFLIDEDGNFAVQNVPSPMQSVELILDIEKLFK